MTVSVDWSSYVEIQSTGFCRVSFMVEDWLLPIAAVLAWREDPLALHRVQAREHRAAFPNRLLLNCESCFRRMVVFSSLARQFGGKVWRFIPRLRFCCCCCCCCCCCLNLRPARAQQFHVLGQDQSTVAQRGGTVASISLLKLAQQFRNTVGLGWSVCSKSALNNLKIVSHVLKLSVKHLLLRYVALQGSAVYHWLIEL